MFRVVGAEVSIEDQWTRPLRAAGRVYTPACHIIGKNAVLKSTTMPLIIDGASDRKCQLADTGHAMLAKATTLFCWIGDADHHDAIRLCVLLNERQLSNKW